MYYSECMGRKLGGGCGDRTRPRPHCVTLGSSPPHHQKRGKAPEFSVIVYCGQTAAHLSYCRALVCIVLAPSIWAPWPLTCQCLQPRVCFNSRYCSHHQAVGYAKKPDGYWDLYWAALRHMGANPLWAQRQIPLR